jgi:hypothetical protein
MLLSIILPLLFVLICVPIVVVLYGITRWQSDTIALRARLEASRSRAGTRIFDTQELNGLPDPVQRFFQAALTPGQPLIAVAELGQSGQFNLSETNEQWARFSATQIVVTQRPGFDWDARIRQAAGIHIFVHDTYIAGEGVLKAALFGLITLAKQRDRLKLAEGDLMRFLAEAAWYPTKLLPSQGVQWEAIDEDSARATITDRNARVSLVFGFDDAGMIRSVRADGRYRTDKGKQVETPWEGRFWGYEIRSGMRIPIQGEAAWILPSGRHPYWRGQVTEVLYKFAS